MGQKGKERTGDTKAASHHKWGLSLYYTWLTYENDFMRHLLNILTLILL